MAMDSSLSSLFHGEGAKNEALLLDRMTQIPGPVQAFVLEDILRLNKDTEYLRRFDLGEAIDTFKDKVPVIEYEDIQPEIRRIHNGDSSPILSSRPISELLTSSGTSAGEKKLMPTIHEDMDRRVRFYGFQTLNMNRHVPDLDKGKALYFFFIREETKTPGGLVARPVLTSYYKSKQFLNRPFDPYNVCTSPNEAILCPDLNQSMYAQLLCGLEMRKEVSRIGAVFPSGLLRVIGVLQEKWPMLAEDIESGTLNRCVTDPALRKVMGRILKPDPVSAKFIREECGNKNNWGGIIRRIWPNTKYVEVILTGAMAQYIETVDFYSGGIPTACTMYGSSECYFGINMNPICEPEDVSYTLMPNMGFFEFIPQNAEAREVHAPPRLVDLADVEVGKEYELVVTTYAGLCRYRVGDILRVTGFHNSAPEFKFVRRKNVLLSIDADKTNESELQEAVDIASRILMKSSRASVAEYTSYADTKSIPGHYVIYVELLWKGVPHALSRSVMATCCLEMERSLSSVYRQERAGGSIGALETRVVKSGTFKKLMDYAISRGASINQYKAPRCVSLEPVVKLLDSNVASAHFSPSAPEWNP